MLFSVGAWLGNFVRILSSHSHASSILVERVPIGQLFFQFFHFPDQSGGSHATDFISQVWTCKLVIVSA